MQINKKLISYNFNKGGNSKKYIVVHDTANTRNGANAEMHYKYFNSGNVGASAHYFVDDMQVVQCVEDGDRAWHAGKKYGVASRSEVNNSNSIGIEICVNSDGNYQKAYDNAVELTAYLMKIHGISIDNVVTHFEACAKTCPATMTANSWQLWKVFKLGVSDKLKPAAQPTETKPTVKFDLFGEKTLVADGFIQDGVTYVKARQILEAVGFIVDWNDTLKTVAIRRKNAIAATAEEIVILEKIVEAEAGGEDERGKILVCNVIFNRMKDKGFPNTIKDVVFQERQFEPTRNGAYDRAIPSEATVKAVNKALSGEDYSQGSRYFCSLASAAKPDSWHEKSLKFQLQHGGHKFYL